RGTPIPFRERRAGNDADQMPVVVVVFAVVDVLQVGLLLFLHVAVKTAAANDVEQLRSAADAEDRKIMPQGMPRQANFDLVLQGMRFFEITETGLVVIV